MAIIIIWLLLQVLLTAGYWWLRMHAIHSEISNRILRNFFTLETAVAPDFF